MVWNILGDWEGWFLVLDRYLVEEDFVFDLEIVVSVYSTLARFGWKLTCSLIP